MKMSSTMEIERVVGIIKPHAVQHRLAIVRRIQISGFHVLQERCVKLSAEQAATFLDGKFSAEIESFSCGPSIVLCLARQNAFAAWHDLMGPKNCSVAKQNAPSSLRALYGEVHDEAKNAVYGSSSQDDVERELQFFFPGTSHEPSLNNHLCAVIYQPLTNALYEMSKVKPDDPLEWLANYMLMNNNNKPTIHEVNPKVEKC